MCSFLLSLTYFFSVSKEAECVMAESVSAAYRGGGGGTGLHCKTGGIVPIRGKCNITD